MYPGASRRTVLGGIAGLAAAPFLAGCVQGSQGAGADIGPVETSRLRVGVLPIVGGVPLTVGVERGFFRENGLSVELKKIRSAEVVIEDLIKGNFDIIFGNYVSVLSASAAGRDLRIVAEASRGAPNNFAIVVMPDSPIQRVRDLVGKSIGVNAPDNVATLTTSSVLETYDVGENDVTYKPFDFPVMAETLERGDVDAAFLPEPFLTLAQLDLGVRTVLDPCSGPTDGLPIDGYTVTGKFARNNPNTVKAFREGILRAQRICAQPDVLTPGVIKVAGVDRETAELVSQSDYPVSLNAVQLQRVSDLMQRFNVIDRKLNVADVALRS